MSVVHTESESESDPNTPAQSANMEPYCLIWPLNNDGSSLQRRHLLGRIAWQLLENEEPVAIAVERRSMTDMSAHHALGPTEFVVRMLCVAPCNSVLCSTRCKKLFIYSHKCT